MKDYAEITLKCIKLLRSINDAANKRDYIEAKNMAWDLMIAAEELDNSFDRHIIIHEPDGSFTVNVKGGIVNVEDNVS